MSLTPSIERVNTNYKTNEHMKEIRIRNNVLMYIDVSICCIGGPKDGGMPKVLCWNVTA